MTFEEAWGELGVEEGAEPDSVRRAYLRLLKKRKPEVDPEGFRRLREAYEICRNLAVPAEVEVEIEAKPSEVEPAPAEPPTASSLPGFAPAEEIGENLRAGRLDVATEQMRARLDGAAGTVGVEVPPPWIVLDTVLALYEQQAFGWGSALVDSFWRWLTTMGGESQILEGQLAAQWAIVLELRRLGHVYPQLHALIAHGARQGDVTTIEPKIHWLRTQIPMDSTWVVKELRGQAPILASMLARSFQGKPYENIGASPKKGGASLPWTLVFPGMIILRYLTQALESCAPPQARRSLKAK